MHFGGGVSVDEPARVQRIMVKETKTSSQAFLQPCILASVADLVYGVVDVKTRPSRLAALDSHMVAGGCGHKLNPCHHLTQ